MLLVPTWLRYKRVDLEHIIKSNYNPNGPSTEFLDEILGPHYLSAGIGDNILLPYLPEVFHEIEDYVVITESESVELENLQDAIQQIYDDRFIETAELSAIQRWEKIYNIQADPTTETLEFRRHRLLNRKRTKPPFTRRWLQQQLDLLVGPGMTIVSVDYANRLLTVTTNIDNANIFKEVIHTIQTVKPANMEYQQNTSLGDVMELEHHISKQDIMWNYKLDGSWKLGEKPFSTLGAEEVIV